MTSVVVFCCAVHGFHPAGVCWVCFGAVVFEAGMVVGEDVVLLEPGFDDPGMGHPEVAEVDVGALVEVVLIVSFSMDSVSYLNPG